MEVCILCTSLELLWFLLVSHSKLTNVICPDNGTYDFCIFAVFWKTGLLDIVHLCCQPLTSLNSIIWPQKYFYHNLLRVFSDAVSVTSVSMFTSSTALASNFYLWSWSTVSLTQSISGTVSVMLYDQYHYNLRVVALCCENLIVWYVGVTHALLVDSVNVLCFRVTASSLFTTAVNCRTRYRSSVVTQSINSG